MQPFSNTREAIDYMLAIGAWSENDLNEWVLPYLATSQSDANSIIAIANKHLNPKPEIDCSEEAKAQDLARLKRLKQEMAASEQRMAELARKRAQEKAEYEQEKAKHEHEKAKNEQKIAEHDKRICYFTRMLKHCYATARPVQSTARQSHCRASASRTRTTGSNAKKATSGSGGDPDPEPRRQQPRLSGLLALRNVLTASRTLIAANTYRLEVLA